MRKRSLGLAGSVESLLSSCTFDKDPSSADHYVILKVRDRQNEARGNSETARFGLLAGGEGQGLSRHSSSGCDDQVTAGCC